MAKNTVRNKEFIDNQWKKGDPSPNPSGRPKGQRNYATIYRDVLLKIAELDHITPEDLENDIIATAVKKAREGDPIFYKDMMDRIHGRPTQLIGGDKDNPIELNVTGVEIMVRK